MIQAMDTLLATYEKGKLTRRQLLQGLAVVAAPVERQTGAGVLRTVRADAAPAECSGTSTAGC